MTTHVDYPSEQRAAELAQILSEMASDAPNTPEQYDDGVVHVPFLDRRGDRLFERGEDQIWFDLSDGAPREQHEDGAELPHKVQHVDAPMTEQHGRHSTGDGWLLISSDGTSWQPEAFVPGDFHE